MSLDNPNVLKDPNHWRVELGLFPVPLFLHTTLENRYVMLNGTRGNFCLDVGGEIDSINSKNIAWSSNVGHYVSILENSIEINRWDTSGSRREHFEAREVLRDIDTFHRYLENDIPYGQTVINHSIRVFRKLRAVLGNSYNGIQSLKAFLILIACAKDIQTRSKISLSDWRLSSDALHIADDIRQGDWDALVNDLLLGSEIIDLKPNLPILLTHAIGDVFQEAHFEAINIPQDQMRFEGFLPSPTETKYEPTIKGVHFTPPALARTLVEEAIFALGNIDKTISIFDPACGSGEFLREALRQLRLRGFEGNIHLIGWDVSEGACDMAKFSLAHEERNQSGPLQITIEQHNSIEDYESWPQSIDLIVMNPPFVSYQDMDTEERKLMRSFLGELSKGRFDLSYAFIYGALNIVKPKGVIASIVPASFLDADSAILLRQRFREEMSLSLLARLGSHSLFARSIVDTGLLVAKKEDNNKSPVAFWSDHRSSSTSAGLRTLRRKRILSSDAPIVEKGFSIYPNPNLTTTAGSWSPRPFKSWKLAQDLINLPKVKELFNIRQGVLTGHNETFILSEAEFMLLPQNEREFFRPGVINQSIKKGYLKKIAYVFYPHGTHKIENETTLKELLPQYFSNNLLPNKDKLLSRARIDIHNWWGLSEHRVWQEKKWPKLISTYFGDAGSFAWDGIGDYCVVQGFAWIPKTEIWKNAIPPKIGLSYLAFLNSQVFSELLSAFSNHVSGGQWNLSKQFVDTIPIPNFFSEDYSSEIINLLADLGEAIYIGDQVDWDQINLLVYDLLGL